MSSWWSNPVQLGFYYLFGFFYMLIFQFSIFLFVFPIILLRQVAIYTAKFRSDFGEPLSPTDVVLSEDVTKKHTGSAMVTMTLKGIISASELRILFMKNVIERRLPENGNQLQFPELKQYQVNHLGFLFYKNDPDFKIENYIHPDINQEDDADFRCYNTIIETVSYRPYPPKRSAWEMFVLPNFKDPTILSSYVNSEPVTLVILRMHHSQIDGFSCLSMLITGLGQKASYVTPKPGTLQNTEVFRWYNAIPKVVEGFVNLQLRYLHNIKFKQFAATRNPNAVGKVHHRICPPVPKEAVKKIAQKYCVRLPAVLMALVAHNLAKVLGQSEIMPESAYASYGIPMPNHPGKLTNHVKVGSVSLTLRYQNLVTRMKELNTEFLKLKDDPTTDVIMYIGRICGSLFPPMTKFLVRNSAYVPFSITNFAGDSEGFSVGGRECVNLTATCGPHEDISGSPIF
ncbi:unnamed protein product [Orchesella dallaii]|uniref:Diacylglycerol O-acyltransferase n=1 Tax=Orchesella dallaii TaxID=48710 RepID=A0ABP1R4N9_9HEXA